MVRERSEGSSRQAWKQERIDLAIEHGPRHQRRRDRRQDDPFAAVAGRGVKPVPAGNGSEVGELIGGAGTKAGPGAGEREIAEPGGDAIGAGEDVMEAGEGDAGIEADVFERRSHDQGAVGTGNEDELAAEDHVAKDARGSVEREHLPAPGPTGNEIPEASAIKPDHAPAARITAPAGIVVPPAVRTPVQRPETLLLPPRRGYR